MKFIAAILGCFTILAFACAQPAKFIPIEKTIFYELGDKTLPIRILQYGNVKDIVCINLHDNENTAVEAAQSVLELRGGILIMIGNNGQRNIRFGFRESAYTFDPNRIFSRTGIEQTLSENSQPDQWAVLEVEKFADRLLRLIPGDPTCIIALHNNTEEAYSVRSYLPGSDRQSDAKAVYMNPRQDVDDFALTTDSLLYHTMAELGYNSILQDNRKVKEDGSLSVYYGEKGKSYINIETQHGHQKQYIEMLDKLLVSLALEK